MIRSLAMSLQNSRPSHIFLMCNGLQVRRINTSANPTKMVQFQSICNWTH